MQDASHKLVIVARTLLPAGLEALEDRFEVKEGGIDGTREQLLGLVPEANALISDPTVKVDDELLDAAGGALMIVANFAVGHDNIDLEACRRREIVVTNTPNVLIQATAELALALTLATARRMSDAERELREGRWRGWDPGAYLGIELSGATVGVVGMGGIGRRYSRLVKSLGAQVVYTSPRPKLEAERALDARRLELPDLLAASDIVSLHAPANDETHHLIGRPELDRIGPGAILINTSRGPLVDEAELAAALTERRLGGAGLDVYEHEPEIPQALLDAPRCVLLPHIGSATSLSRDAMALLVADNVAAVLEGREPRTPVS